MLVTTELSERNLRDDGRLSDCWGKHVLFAVRYLNFLDVGARYTYVEKIHAK